MPDYLVGEVSQIPPGEGRSFVVGSREIAVFHTREAGMFATQAICPHRGGPLADGLTDQANIVCPLHDRIFSLKTGEGIGNEFCIATYPLKLIDNRIYIAIE